MAATTPSSATTTATVRFRKTLTAGRSTKKRQRASGYLREYVARFGKADPSTISIDPKLNEYIMSTVVGTGSSIQIEITRSAGKISVRRAGAAQQPAPAAAQSKSASQAQAGKEGFPQEAAKKPAQHKTEAKAKSTEKKQAAADGEKALPAAPEEAKPVKEGAVQGAKPRQASKAQTREVQPDAENTAVPETTKPPAPGN